MFTSSFSKKLLLLTLLTSVATLTACGQKEAQPAPASSSSGTVKVTAQSSSTSAKSFTKSTNTTSKAQQASLTEAETEDDSAEHDTEEAVSEASETAPAIKTTEETSAPSSEVTKQATSFDLDGLAAGDYSSIAGTWANAEGEVITVNADGEMTVQRTDGDSFTVHMRASGITETGYVYGGVGSYHGDDFWSNAVIAIVPAGTANIVGEVGEQDHIEIGHGTHAANPEKQYFRQ